MSNILDIFANIETGIVEYGNIKTDDVTVKWYFTKQLTHDMMNGYNEQKKNYYAYIHSYTKEGSNSDVI